GRLKSIEHGGEGFGLGGGGCRPACGCAETEDNFEQAAGWIDAHGRGAGSLLIDSEGLSCPGWVLRTLSYISENRLQSCLFQRPPESKGPPAGFRLLRRS